MTQIIHRIRTAGWLVLGSLQVTATAAENLPTAPQQTASWRMPDGVPDPDGVVAKTVETLFRLGMADPRGCPYHHLTVRENGREYPARGWVLPTDDATKQRYAISWNGLIYPVEKVGKEADLKADLVKPWASLDPFAENERPPPDAKPEVPRISPKGLQALQASDPEAYRKLLATDPLILEKPFDNYREEGLAHVLTKGAWLPRIARDEPLPYLLLRLGIPILLTGQAEDPFEEAAQIKNPFDEALTTADPAFGRDDFFGTHSRWLVDFAILARNDGVAAFMAGNDALAAARLKVFDDVWQEVAKRLPQAKPNDDDPFAVVETRPTLDPIWRSVLADAARRLQPQSPTAGSELARTIASWDELDTWDEAAPPPAVSQVIAAGNSAVEPLLDCLEHDWRWTRIDHGWVDHDGEFQHGDLLRVKDLALFALERVLRFEVVDRHSAANQPPDEWYRQATAEDRDFCRKYGSACRGELWFRILADDTATTDQQLQAASLIVRLHERPDSRCEFYFPDEAYEQFNSPVHSAEGELLLGRRNPSVLDLLKKAWRRARSEADKTLAAGAPEVREFGHMQLYAPRFNADDFVCRMEEWQPGNVEVLREHYQWLADAVGHLRKDDIEGWICILPLCERNLIRRMWSKDETAMRDYDALFKVCLKCDQVPTKVMLQMTDQPGMDALAKLAFLGPDAPLNLVKRPWDNSRTRADLISVYGKPASPLLILPSFRHALVEALGNTTKQATLAIGKNAATLTYEHTTTSAYPESLTPDATLRCESGGSSTEVRLCDLIAWHLTPKRGPAVWTSPSFHLDDPLPDRDRTIQQWIKILSGPTESARQNF